MNWQNKEGDIKQILEAQEFAFNPRDWEAAEKLLLLRKKRRKKRRLAIITLPVALLLAVGIYHGANTLRPDISVAENRQDKTTEINTAKNPGEENPASINTLPKNGNNSSAAESSIANNSAGNELINTKKTTINTAPFSETPEVKTPPVVPPISSETKEAPVITNNDNKELKDEQGIIPVENKENRPLKELQATDNTAGEKPLTVADTSMETAVNPEPEPAKEEAITKKDKDKTEPKVKHKIGVTLGGNYSRLLSVQRGRFAVLPYFAINYGYVFNSKWQLGTGLAYSVVNGGGLQKRYSVSTHTFGETHTELTIQTRRLHYLEMPLMARYNFNDKLFFTGGVNAGYLLGIKGSVNENTTGIFAKSPGYSQKASDYMGGLKTWDVQLQLGAEYRYKKQFYLGGLINAGMLDIGNDQYYNSSAFERNLRLQLYIRYELWNF